MNLPPFPKNPMLLAAPDYDRYVFKREHRSGLTEWFFYDELGFQWHFFKKSKNPPQELTPEEANKLARNLWREIFGDGEQMV